MYPEIHVIGAPVPSYLVMLVAAALVCHWLGPIAAQRLEGIPRWKTRSVLAWLGVAAFAGGRAHFVSNAWSFGAFASHPLEILAFWRGLHAGGALIALVVALPFVVRAHGLDAARFIDALCVPIAIGIALARVGCFLQGCCFGIASDLPWAVSFPVGSPVASFQAAAGLVSRDAQWSLPVHPLQLYFAGAALLAALSGLWTYRRRTYGGRCALVTSATFLTLCAFIETVRAPYYPKFYFWAGTLQFEWIAIALAVVALAALCFAETRPNSVPVRRVLSTIRQ